MLRRRLAVLLAMAVMLAMTLASGVALADPGYGKGGGKASRRTSTETARAPRVTQT